MSKIGNIPEFTDGESEVVEPTEEESTEEVKEEEETPEAEETESETSEDDKSTEDKTEEIKKDKSTSEPEKLKALEGLRKQEENLDKDTSELDKEIEIRRERIVEKRRERRDKRDIVGKIDTVEPTEEVDKLDDIDPTTIAILERFTKAKGLVPKAELEKTNYESKHKDAESIFYDKHKEYDPANDKDDTLYKALQKELSLYARPIDAKLIPKLFEKAHSEVKKQYSQFFKETTINDKVNASERIKAASMGGGNTGSSSKQPKAKEVLTSTKIDILRRGGWTEEEIANLNK